MQVHTEVPGKVMLSSQRTDSTRRRGACAAARARCPFHKYTASPCDLASFPRKRESRGQELWGLDACVRRHDVQLASNLRNRHLVPG